MIDAGAFVAALHRASRLVGVIRRLPSKLVRAAQPTQTAVATKETHLSSPFIFVLSLWTLEPVRARRRALAATVKRVNGYRARLSTSHIRRAPRASITCQRAGFPWPGVARNHDLETERIRSGDIPRHETNVGFRIVVDACAFKHEACRKRTHRIARAANTHGLGNDCTGDQWAAEERSLERTECNEYPVAHHRHTESRHISGIRVNRTGSGCRRDLQQAEVVFERPASRALKAYVGEHPNTGCKRRRSERNRECGRSQGDRRSQRRARSCDRRRIGEHRDTRRSTVVVTRNETHVARHVVGLTKAIGARDPRGQIVPTGALSGSQGTPRRRSRSQPGTLCALVAGRRVDWNSTRASVLPEAVAGRSDSGHGARLWNVKYFHCRTFLCLEAA